MKTKLLTFITIVITLVSHSQTNILLVTDNDVDASHNTTFYNSLLNTTYTNITLVEANSILGLPNATQVNNADLVIWFCGDDGASLNFWNEGIGGPANITSYLDNGGKFWLIGNDVIYGYYAGAPDMFLTGEFMFDYAWLNTYNMQTNVDDGQLGVPQVDKTNTANSNYPSPLTWVFETLWYADGVGTKPETESIYEFGPASYPYAGETTMTFYENSTFSVMTTLFNPIRISSTNDLDLFTQAAIDQIFESSLSVDKNKLSDNSLKIYPNPSEDDHFNISIKNEALINKNYKLYNLLGNLVSTGELTNFDNEISTTNLSKGTYFLKIDSFNFIKRIILH